MTTYPHTDIHVDHQIPAIRMTRDFTASPAQLHRAHTDPELFARWIGPDDIVTTIIQWDARTGGSWRYLARRSQQDAQAHRGDGAVPTDPTDRAHRADHADQREREFGFHGCFHQVSADRIVQTFTFEGWPDEVSLETVTFEDLGDGRTRLHAESVYTSFEARDQMIASGMERGVNDGYAKLDALLAADAPS